MSEGRFHVGQKVLCVKVPAGAVRGEETPIKGKVYRIREVETWPHGTGVRLHEIHNMTHNYPDIGRAECLFLQNCFRPIDDTRLEIFRKMLVSKPVEVA